eukprot:gnl/Chilomastix_caulleri/2718.p1 GENE.gnl/Chilomastix_caulleri/2718~~gnl/Chilomastix_caulleri/2718.p1  ORF type:complete len:104 (+),score=13.85 gnl/Chilomastix_caulleri/2718:43-354(+)
MDVRIEALQNGAEIILIKVLEIRPITLSLQQRILHVLSFISSEQHIHEDETAHMKFKEFTRLIWTKKMIDTLRRLGTDTIRTSDPSLNTIVEYIKTIFSNITK